MEPTTDQAQKTDVFNPNIRQRLTELAGHQWTRSRSEALAKLDGIELTDEHWAVIVFLRRYYLEKGLPAHARVTAQALNEHFTAQGGSAYLQRLFAGGPVTQGSRLANLRMPPNASDSSIGIRY
ncbi:MAG: TusE/DsrC/DsvC family sulfur relay protein [Pseudomonadota bacterium]|nr:MAG: TusE/DsrC/DsvC family sulfur relay protein [Pseudomonadota bacterium]